jgi:carotenoid cleavage dioxygenase-like enzyme
MKRRDFLKVATAAPLMPSLALAHNPLPHSSFPESIMTASLSESSGVLNVLEGQVPNDMFGHVIIAEGIPLEKNHLSPNGKGAVTRLDIADGVISHLRKMINTPSSIMQEHVTGLLDRFNLLGGTIYQSPSMGYMNYCNTAPNYMGDNRFSFSYEGGMPFEFDATTLDLVTPIGDVHEWKSSLPPFIDFFTPKKHLFPQIRTTGHPFFDLETSECFTINYGGNIGSIGIKDAYLKLIHWDLVGQLHSWNVVDRQGNNAYIKATSHSLGVTRNYILIFQTAARVEPTRVLGTINVAPQEHQTPVWIIRKSDLNGTPGNVVADYLELNFDTSDIMCNFDDSGGEVTLYGQYLGAMDKSEQLFNWERLYFGGRVAKELSGYPIAPVDVGGLVRARIRIGSYYASEIKQDFKVIRDERLLWDMNDPAYRGHFQFPETFEHIYWSAIGYRPEHVSKRVADAYSDYPQRMFSNDSLPKEAIPSALVHMDCQTMTISDSYSFPDDCVMRTPQFMARENSTAQDDGYIFTAVVRKYPQENSNGKEYWFFDAKNLAQGPICKLGHNVLNFATTNHALWVPSIGARPVNAYRANYGDFLREKLPLHNREVRQLIEQKLLPQFG